MHGRWLRSADVHCPGNVHQDEARRSGQSKNQQLVSCAGCRSGSNCAVQCAQKKPGVNLDLYLSRSVALQEHFYLEPHCSVVIPKEHDEFEVYASTQVRWRSDCTDAPESCC